MWTPDVQQWMIDAVAQVEREAMAVQDELSLAVGGWRGVSDEVEWRSPAAEEFRRDADRGREFVGRQRDACGELAHELHRLRAVLQEIVATRAAA